MKTSRITASTAAGIALVLALAACGGDTDDASDDAASPPAATETDEGDHTDHGMTPTEEPTEDTTGTEAPGPTSDGTDLSAVTPEGTGNPFADARTAAHHMPETGESLAAGFVEALDIDGDVSSEAAALRGELTALLQEHVYLAAIGVATAYVAGPDSAEFELAAEQIDANSVALADLVGELAGDDKRQEFLDRWRDHIGYFVDYALAAADGDEAGKTAAVDELRQYTQDAGAFFEEVSGGELPAAAVTESLDGHVDTLAVAVDALAAGDPEAFAHLKHAADHVVAGAAVLATGLSTAAGLEGDPNDPASEIRAALTANLNEHVYVAGIAVFVAYTAEGGPESDAFAGAAAVVDANAVELAAMVGILAGEEYAEPFLELWRDHIGYFVDYAVAVAGNDDASAQAALADLDQYRYDAGEFFEEISAGALPADVIADGLGMHVRSLGGAIDSLNEALVQGS